MQSDTKTKILERSARLFFQEGFATGIDRVTDECGTAKMTVYQHFKSKAGLICAILRVIQSRLHEEIRCTTDLEMSPGTQLEAACFTLCRSMNDPDLRVGLTVRALIEFPHRQHPIHEAARQFDLAVLKWFEPFCAGALLPESHLAARQILHVAKGSFLMTPTMGAEASANTARDLLRPLLAQVERAQPHQSGKRASNGHAMVPAGSRL